MWSGTGMGWLRLVGSFKLYVSFAEYSLFYRALLQKRPVIWSHLLIVATPYFAQSRVKSHIWMSHVTRMNESWLLIDAGMNYYWCLYTHLRSAPGSWQFHLQRVASRHVCVRGWPWYYSGLNASFICLLICATWLIHVCGMTHSYVWHDSLRCVTWLIHMCDMTHLDVWHDSFICVTWLV